MEIPFIQFADNCVISKDFTNQRLQKWTGGHQKWTGGRGKPLEAGLPYIHGTFIIFRPV